MPEFGETAIVLGASIAGLMAARVLADFYTTVIVVERDVPPDEPVARRGVPHGTSPHIPQVRATQTMEELFPGLLDEMVVNGARVWKDGDLSRIWMSYGGHEFLRSGSIPDPESVIKYFVNRPFLEWIISRRVRAIPNVEFLAGHDVVSLTSTPARNRITGVVVAQHDSGAERTLAAELVVDATGRGSRTPVFLVDLGYDRPREDELMVHAAYASTQLRVPHEMLREYMAVGGALPSRPMGFAMFGGENDTYMLGIQMMAGGQPPADRDALLARLAEVAPAHVVEAARHGEPLGPLRHHRFPANRWRRYDKLTRTPDGLIVVGDAMCSFNPIYGQGMSIAAVEAVILRDCLQHGDRGLPRRYFRAAAKEIRIAWRTAVGADLTLPQIPGRRPLSMRITNAYLRRVLAAAETDPVVVQQFMRLIGMVDPPSRLLRPSMLVRVLRKSRKRAEADKPAPETCAIPT
ncbi:FAD-dependent oxidoreductase [Mycobacterium conspicuum]|jgi:2-polyprenyl-6-methoxyphenol hydroxylase-like FAD-dependent oxidoreductase|uniref:Hydroxylase n=1 Tax=Mycobacterium conspicuum TaxID=44010 RepID=A0A1X1TNM2_9MYCO|nr:FAD-dependent monooxygenase [Mycobacterium conspicuum]ORV46113.1 2-polyprenyl-6-methoxyphenol hydroxylase-like oxidoreductase [Mycobacterium conspicuum]BBZ37936.1 hydroxylase [Mycobacterium conspicuum]